MSALDMLIETYGVACLCALYYRATVLAYALAAITAGLALMRWGLSCPS